MPDFWGAATRKFAILFAALAFSGPAFAADLAIPVKAPPPAPVPVYNWTGFYAGLNIGGGWGQASNNFNFAPATGGVFPIATDSSHPDGVIGGGQFGYNWQTGSMVLGIETDIQGSGQRGSATAPGAVATCAPGCTISETDKLTWFGTTRGRIGAASGGWLAYVTGGAAYGGLKSTGVELVALGGQVPFSNSTTRAGWTIGGGVEAALIGNWTWKVEYLYMDLGTANFATPVPVPPFLAGNDTQAMHFTDSIVRGGLNLRF